MDNHVNKTSHLPPHEFRVHDGSNNAQWIAERRDCPRSSREAEGDWMVVHHQHDGRARPLEIDSRSMLTARQYGYTVPDGSARSLQQRFQGSSRSVDLLRENFSCGKIPRN
ncbi:MAG: hypothetical protein QUS33_13130 [Dehalococcoidia bacterium]|nr:hypothetical protein [Dehalococcoidia bacterium]